MKRVMNSDGVLIRTLETALQLGGDDSPPRKYTPAEIESLIERGKHTCAFDAPGEDTCLRCLREAAAEKGAI